MAEVTNVAAYQFAELNGLREWRAELLVACRAWNLKGTMLLSGEGINLFMAGACAEIEQLLALLRTRPGLASLKAKYSTTDRQPFTRLLIRLKKEIIAFGVEGIRPAQHTSPKLGARELKRWLDEGRPVTLLDTRNDYEVKLGTFRNARTLGLDHFRNFPQAVQQLPPELKDRLIVMFCTGGIRCEKAGPYMEREGYKHVHQLEGGILRYFEECGSAHYDGECFVFDQRVGVDPALNETDSALCFRCQSPLTAEELNSPLYVAGESCPACWHPPEAERAAALATRQSRLDSALATLPGALPYDNVRPLKVPAACDGFTVAALLSCLFPQLPAAHWLPLVEAGRFRDQHGSPVKPDSIVRSGQRLAQLVPGTVEPDVSTGVQLLYEDEAIIVLNKPAPLPMHPCGRFNRNTLSYFLELAYRSQKPRPAHRLDANTTGVVLACRTRHHAALIQPQFERGEVIKRYLVRVQGHPAQTRFSCDAGIAAQKIRRGAREIAADKTGDQRAITEFTCLEKFADGTSLLEARPLTGRTHQIRLHLRHLNFPVIGDPLYGLDEDENAPPTLALSAPPLCLHAWQLECHHPIRNERMNFTADPPSWARWSQAQ